MGGTSEVLAQVELPINHLAFPIFPGFSHDVPPARPVTRETELICGQRARHPCMMRHGAWAAECAHRSAMFGAGVMPTATAGLPAAQSSSRAMPVPIVIPIEGESKAAACPKGHAVPPASGRTRDCCETSAGCTGESFERNGAASMHRGRPTSMNLAAPIKTEASAQTEAAAKNRSRRSGTALM